MPDPSTSLRATAGGIDVAALLRPIFTDGVPYSEWASRTRYGAELDTARIDNALRAADMGIMWPIADMARESIGLNPKAQGILGKALMPLGAADWDLTPAEGDGISQADATKIATKIRTMIAALPGFRQALLDLAFAYFDGRAALEKQVARRPTGTGFEFWPMALDWIQPQRLSYEQSRRLIVVDRWSDTGMFTKRGPALDDVPGKFISFMPRMFNDLQEREGLAPRYLFWLLFDRVNWRQRFLVAERFGIPWLLIETEIMKTLGGMKLGLPTRQDGGESGAPADDAKSLDYTVKELNNLTQDGKFVGLPGQKLTTSWPPDSVREFFSQGSDQILDRLAYLTLHDSTSVATGQGGGDRATAIVLKDGESTLLDFRGWLLSEAVQVGLVNVLVELNYGADALPLAPKFQLRTQPPRDRDKELGRAKTVLVDLGVPLAAATIYEVSGFRPPNPGEALAEPPPPMSSGPFGEGGAEPAALPNGEGASATTTGALQELLEDADEDDQADAADAEADGQHLARWFASEGRKLQPSSANGSPEVIIERGVREGARLLTAWTDALLDACAGDDGPRIYRNLARVTEGLNVEPFARAIERRLAHGLMLGGLDSHHEMTSDVTITPVSFAMFAGGVKDFTTMPFGEAIKAFTTKQVVTRRTFDRMLASAKHRAFTVAGLTKRAMLQTAHSELGRALADGADLRTFREQLGKRFDAAGWTRLNPSHVENVFRTNIMGAYADGRRAQMTQPAVLAARPYWQILGVDDARTRKTHREAHGKVLAASDPFFTNSGPPFGFQCRCRVISRSSKDLARLGLTPTIGAALRGLPDEGWSTDAIAEPFVADDSTSAPAPSPAVVGPPPAPPPALEDLPEEDLPPPALPPEGVKAYEAHLDAQFDKIAPEESIAVQRFTKGYDWAIREVDKGTSDAEIIAGIEAHRAKAPGKKFAETPAEHLELAKVYRRDLYTALAKMEPVSPRVVYRGLTKLDKATFDAIRSSATIEIGAVSSTTWNVDVAKSFADLGVQDPGTHGILFALKARSAVGIETASHFREERELLLKKGVRFRVTKIYRPTEDASAVVIEAEEI